MDSQNLRTNIEQKEQDRITAVQILRALCDSSLSQEFEMYADIVQKELGLDRETMERVYSLNSITDLLSTNSLPKRYFRGKRVFPSMQPHCTTSNLLPSSSVLFNCTPPSSDQEIPPSHFADTIPSLTLPPTKNTTSMCDSMVKIPIMASFEPVVKTNEQKLEESKGEDSDIDEESEGEDTNDSDIDEEHMSDPSVTAFISLMASKGINTVEFDYDYTTYTKALVVYGDTKPIKNTLRNIGGKWNGKLKGFIFSKKKLLKKMQSSQYTDEQVEERLVTVPVEDNDSDSDFE